MDAFDNPARDGMAGPQRDGVSIDQTNQAVAGSELLAAAASVTATASAIPLAIQAILVPDASGRIVLPAGVSIDDITVSGTDLIVTLPNGQVIIIPGGAINIPSIVVDGDTVPASTVAQLLENLNELNPEAGIRSSGGNFADPEGAIQDPYALGDLLPYTELAFPQPEDREIIPAIPDEEDPTVVIVTPDQPAGSVDATANVNEAGLPARGNEPAGSNSAANSETVTGSILIDTPDGAGSVTLNGVAVTAVGQVFTTPLGQLVITSIAPGSIGYSYTLTDNTNANNNLTDLFAVVVTDSDGDTATANLTISIIDDVPTARADTDQVAAATFTPETGNVISGAGTTSGTAGTDTQGADGAALTGIRAGTAGTEFTAPGSVIQGQYGTLTIDAQGNYTYVRGANTPGGVSDVFTYRLADGDGDTSIATLTIAIGDSPSVISFIRTEGPSSDVAESGLAPREGEPAGSAFDGDAETATDTLTFVAPDGVGSVTINGVAVTPGALPQQIFADATGTLVINSYSYNPATGQGAITYTYTLNDNMLAGSGTNATFDVVVTDRDGDVAEGDLTIRIIDDAPTAANDVDSVSEDGPLTADGNVLTGVGGRDANATDGVADTQGADGAAVTAVTGGTVGAGLAGAYGTLTLNADGSYSYVLNNNAQPVQGLSAGQTLTEVFTYTITDGDGDTSTATLTITINGANDGVMINGLNVEGGELTVDEDDLSDGSSPDAAALTQPGSFTVSTPDGLGNVTIGGTQVVTNGVFTPGTATSPLGTVNITGFTPVVGADGSVIGGTFTYEYVLAGNTLTHGAAGEDNVTDSFAVTVTDSDGSTGNASLDVVIIDDVPTAANDADSVTEDGGNGDNPATADGNVLTGAGGVDTNATDGVADTQGADGAAVTAVTGGTVGEGFATAYGTLTLNADGSYSYVLNNNAQPVQGLSAGETLTEVFTYTITDGDGDPDTATLTITINGADDGVTINGLSGQGAELFFDEDDLPARGGEPAGSDPAKEPVTDGGSFSVSTPDGMGAVVLNSFNGAPIGPLTLVTANGSFTPQTVSTAYGTLSITGFTPVTGADGSVIGGSFTYSYTLSDNRIDHGVSGEDNLTDSIGVTVTDSDGSSASGTIDIQITDDVPAAIDDFQTQAVENLPVTINVVANDTQGADGVQPSTAQFVAGSLTGDGTLVNNGDGTFTYTQAPGEVGEVSFQYQITDGDGDQSIATATIMLVADSMPTVRSASDAIVDEDGLPGANADNGLAGEVTSTGSAAATGTIVVDFGGDVPAALAGSLVLNDSAALDTQLTVDGVPVTFAKVGADLVGTVGGNEVIRIALTTATAGPGANEVTYGYSVTLSASIDQAIAGSEDTDILSAIGFTATDNDGSPVSGAFGVTIVDDIPTLTVSDTPTNATEGGPAVAGSWSLDAGADGVESVTVTFGAGSATLQLTAGSSVTIVQPTGTLTVNADGSFTFLATGNQNNALNPSASFTLSAVDRDGDPTSDTLRINIDDGANPVGGDTLTLTVNEAAIDGIGRTPASNAEIDSGTLDFTAGSDTLSGFRFDGVSGLVANLDGAGIDLFWTLSLDGQTITGSLTNGGPAAITISLTAPASVAPGATASATVTVTLADNLPHALAMAAQTQGLGTVTVQATDTDGDVATGVVTVQVIDDIPTISSNAAAANALTVDDSDLTTNATANFGFGQPGSLFNVAFNADGPAAANSIVYALDVKSAGAVSGIIDTATGQTVLLTNEAGLVVGRTSGSGEVVFTLSVDANGTVTLDQQRAVFHTPDTGSDQATGLSAADLITLTATITDGDGDPASATVNIGGALTFKDDGVNIDISVVNEAGVELTTQDGDTILAATDTDVSTANFSGAFTAINANYGADSAGSTSWNYVLSLFGADGVDSALDSHGASIFLYDIGGVITGSTAASAGAVDASNTIFTLGANATNGVVTLSQFAQIDHAIPGVDSNFENQLAMLDNGLVKLTGTVTIVDKDGDTDSATQSIDLGDNVRFADDGPTLDVTLKGGAELRIDETNGVVAAGTEVDPDAAGNLGTATIAIADLYTVTADPGADTPASYSYAFVLGAGNPATGYLISATNEVIRLYQAGLGTVEGRGETSGNVAFTFSVAANGTVTMTQLIAIEHSDTNSNDETSPGMTGGALLLQVTATDFDGDFARDTVDLGSIVRIEDDGPSITNVAGAGSVTLDETGGFDTVTSAAAVITANLNFGADGAATANSIVYGLSLTGGGSTSLTTAVGDFAISLVATGANQNQITGRYTDGGGVVHDAFSVTINADGTLTVSQLVALEHLQDGDTPLHDDALTLNGLITASVTIKDGDDDTATKTTEIGDQITFRDDGPSVTATAAGGALVLNDESATNGIAATINTGAIVKGEDLDVGGTGAISVATSGTAVVTATPVYDADGAAASNALTYALTVTSATSGLTTTDGSPITLVQVGNVIVGQVSGGTFNGLAAFAIAIDPATGVATVEQYLSLGHPNAADPDDMVQLLGNTLGVVVTATDSDGDFARSTTVDISAQIRFDDDGPTISNVAGGASVTLDETGGFDTIVSATPVITASFAYGADGAATTGAAAYGIELTGGGTSVVSGLATAVGDFPITLVETSATTIVGRYTDGAAVVHDAFTISIGAVGKLTVTQLVALEHLQDGEVALHNDALTLNSLISASVTIKDGDNDTATAKTEIGDQITFLDDGPTANADTKSVIEGAVATGNVLTDNADVFGADGAATTSPAGGVVGVRVAGGDMATPVTTGTGTVISTALGDLTLNANGTYSYDAKPNTTSTVITDTFVYTIRDADGDTSTTTLTITIQPVTLAPDNQTKTVNEAGLDLVADGNDVAAGTVVGSNPAATTETVTGTLAVTGTGVTYAPQTVEDALGKFVLNANGTYTYTLKSAFDGATLDNDVTTENGVRVFNYTATDANGNSVPGTITINIIDDIPTARADTDSVIEDAASPATGNVMTGVGTTNAPGSADTQGADGAAVSGVAAGTPVGDVTGNVGSAVAGTYGSLTLGANGGYTYTLNNGNATVQALGVNETLTETFTYTLTDGDGDRTTTTLTITINGSNDLPTIGSATTAVSDEGLPGGFPDATGSVDTTNLTVRTGTIVASDPDGDPLTFSLGAPATALSSGGQPIVWDTTNPQLLLGKVGSNTVISVAIDNSGNFTVSLLRPIDHPNTTLEDALSLVVPVSVNDGTTTVTNATALTIGLEDDSPIAIAPLNASLINAPGSSVYQSLDTDNDVDNNYGGDGPGSVIFTAATIAALQAQNLTSGSQALTYVISAGGTVLTAEKPNGDDVFIIRLQPAGHADQYQVQMVQKLDSTQTVDFNDGGYDFVGGNTAWIGFVKPGDNDSQDILVTPMTAGVDGGTMNANANATGVSAGNSVGSGEAVRIDFVTDLVGAPANGDYATLANQNHAFDAHYTANGASAFFTNIGSSSSVRLVARDDIDTDNDVGDGVKDTITKVAISFGAATLVVTANGTYNVGGQNYTVSFSGGEATVTGVVENTRIAGFTADGYNSIEFHHAGGDTFKMGDFGAVVQTENPVNFNVPVAIVDGDGDSAPASLAITTASPLLVIGSATGDAVGQTTDHVVANPQGQVDGVIQGSNFDDTLVGDPGSVTITEGQQANVVLVLDSSGSMTDQITFGGGTISRMQALKNGVNALIDSLSQSGAQDVRITVIDFDNNGTNLGTFNLVVNGVSQAGQVTLAKAAVNGMSASGGTNYEDGLQDALTWINGGNGIAGADVNKVVFVSDGNPTLWNSGGDGSEDSTNVQNAMNQVLGSDTTNEPQQILATGYSIDSIGVNVSASLLTRLSDVEDGNASGGTGSASNATSAEQLASILQNLGGSTDLAAAGNDVVNGGDGGDVIFGDVLFTDTLATQLGVSLPAGSGWAVFQTLEGRPSAETLDPAGNGADWNRQDTIAYIRANYATLAKESGRTGGSDTINAGTGNDIVFGQEGNDTIDGGTGDDLISGGTGSDILTGGIGNDIFWLANGEFGATESINGGADSDTILLTNATTVNFSANTISGVETLTGSSGVDNVTMTAAQWASFSAIDLAGGSDALTVTVSGTVNISAAVTTVSNVETGSITGSGAADTLTLTGAQLDAILQGSAGAINLAGGGTDTIALTSTSNDLNALVDGNLSGVEAISATGAAAGVKIMLGNQTEAFTITGSGFADRLGGGTANDTMTGGAGADQFRFRSTNNGTDTVTDFAAATDKIALLDIGSTGSGSVDFAATIGTAAGVALTASDFQARTSIANINTTDDNHVIVITAQQTGALIAASTNAATNAYVVVYNSTAGRAEIWFDTDWSSTGGRSLVGVLTGVTAGQVAALTATDFVVYSNPADPIILDLAGDGYSFGATAAFDINADGASDRVTWNSSNDGILAVDLDGNGKIDSGTEIFTPGFGGGNFANGVAALASLDGNGDGVIDAKDAAFASLLVWQDANADGVSDAGELSSLTDQGIASIATGAASTDELIDGQAVTGRGSFTRTDGSTGDYIEVQLDAQLGARGADREAEDAQRTAGNQALTSALVAASLVTMAQGAQAQPETAPKLLADDMPTATAADDGAASSVSAAPTDAASGIGTGDVPAAKDAGPADSGAPSHLDDAGDAPASIDDVNDSGWRSAPSNNADTAAADSLFDVPADHGSSGTGLMDGLLLLAALPAGVATAGAADGAAADAVLAAVLETGVVDQLIDAVTGAEPAQVAASEPPAFDLAQFLDHKVTPDVAFPTSLPLEQDIHSLAAA